MYALSVGVAVPATELCTGPLLSRHRWLPNDIEIVEVTPGWMWWPLGRTHTLGIQPDQDGDRTKPRPWGSLHAVVPLSSTPQVTPYTVSV